MGIGYSCPGFRRRARSGSAAFTLVELLVVTAILAVLVGVIGACLSGGIRVWDTVRTYGEADAQISIALRILERDLANATPFCDVVLQGDAAELTFAGLLREDVRPAAREGWREETAGAETAYALAVVKYRFDASRAALLRLRQPYSAGNSAVNAARAETILAGVQGLTFQYEAGGQGGDRSMQAQWNNPTNFPSIIHVEFTTKGVHGSRHTARAFRIPVQMQPAVAVR